MDSRFRGNDTGRRVRGLVPAEGLGVSPNLQLPGIPLWQRGTEGVRGQGVERGFDEAKAVSAATMKRGPPRTNLDSRFRGNDTGESAGTRPCRGSGEPVSKPFVPVNIETQDYEWG